MGMSPLFLLACANPSLTSHDLQNSDIRPPSGSISLNGGEDWTSDSVVEITISATDNVGITERCFSESSSCTAWESYSDTGTFPLKSGEGTHQVSVFLKDAAGNVVRLRDSIRLDTRAPGGGKVTATPSSETIDLSWANFLDTGIGIEEYVVAYAEGSIPENCDAPFWTGTDTTLSLTGLTNGTNYGIRVCATDGLGQTGTGAIALTRPNPDVDAPANVVLRINENADITATTEVSVHITAEDASGISEVCLSNTRTCTQWQAFSENLSWTLGGEGQRKVYGWVRDPYGNTTAANDTIQVDTRAPWAALSPPRTPPARAKSS